MSNALPTRPNPLGTEKISRLIIKFSVPSIISMLVNAVYNMADQVYIGWSDIGMLGIAATNVAFPLTTISTATALLLGIGGAANFNLKLGAGDRDGAGRVAGNALGLMILAGTAIGALVLVFQAPLLAAFGATENVLPYAAPYVAIIAPGIPFLIFATGACNMIRADGSPNYAMVCMLAGAIFNLVFDPIFLFVFNMGIGGIALATTLGQILSASIAAVYLLRRFKTAPLKRAYLRPRAVYAKAICALGSAACINQLAMTVVQIALNNTLRYYGALSDYGADVPLAAVGAISKLNILFMAFIIGIAQGCQPINSFNYGAKQYGRVTRTVTMALAAGSVVAVLAFLAFQLFPRQLMTVFGEDDPVYLQFSVRYLRVYMLMTFVNCLQPLSSNFFTAIGKARLGIVISLTRQTLFLLPLILLLPVFFGIDGVMVAGPIADGAAAVLSCVLLVRELHLLKALQRANTAPPTETANV